MGSGEKLALLGCSSSPEVLSGQGNGAGKVLLLSVLTVEAVTTGSPETKHLPCDSEQNCPELGFGESSIS